MIKCQKQDGHVQGFSVLRIFSHIITPVGQRPLFWGMLFVSCVFLTESDRIDWTHSRWWQLIFCFSPQTLGKMNPFDEHIFDGLLNNHQAAFVYNTNDCHGPIGKSFFVFFRPWTFMKSLRLCFFLKNVSHRIQWHDCIFSYIYPKFT